MKFSDLSFRTKITTGFAAILLLFIVGLGVSVLGMNRISTMMRLSNKVNQIVKEMFWARGNEKDFLISKKEQSAGDLKKNLANLNGIIADIKSGAIDDRLLTRLDEISGLVAEYDDRFGQTVKNTKEMEELKNRMKDASSVIFDTLDKGIRTPILEAKNLATVHGEEFDPIMEEVLGVANPLMMDLKDARLFENAFIMYNDPEYVPRFNNKIAVWKDTKEDLKYLIDTSDKQDLKDAFATLEKQFETYNSEIFNRIFSLWESNEKIMESMQSDGENISKVVHQLQQDTESEVINLKNSIIKFDILILISGIIIGLLLSYFIVLSIARPIKNTVMMLKDIAEGEGDLTARLEVKSRDEMGDLARWFNTFLDNLRKMIMDIAGNADTLNKSSHGLSGLSGNMSEGVKRISGKTSTVAAASEEMSSNINSVAETMERTASSVSQVATAAEEMTASINEIARNSEKARSITGEAVSEAKSASGNVNELGASAQEIGKVTETITEISEQTNLLALNATIEAARAGEVGKGFAVVANEIKELARQTAGATQEIKGIIEGIQGSTEGAISNIGKISKVIDEVNEIVETIATAIEEQLNTTREIAENVSQTATGIQEVSGSTTQSSTVSGEIARDISDINQSVTEMTNSSSQVNMSAEELSELAEQLKAMVGKFKI